MLNTALQHPSCEGAPQPLGTFFPGQGGPSPRAQFSLGMAQLLGHSSSPPVSSAGKGSGFARKPFPLDNLASCLG